MHLRDESLLDPLPGITVDSVHNGDSIRIDGLGE